MSSRPGFALLEAIIGMTILVAAAASVIALGHQSISAVRTARAAEREMWAAERFIETVALWPREDLDRHLGASRQGPWRLAVERRDSLLFEVALLDSTGRRVLLRTALYRPANDSQSD